MSKLGSALASLAGVAGGGVAAFTVLQKRYDDAVENDIFSIKEAFHKREQKLMNEIADLKENKRLHEVADDTAETETPQTIVASGKHQEKGDLNDYAKMVNRTQYSRTSVPQPPEHEVEAPYVISPEEFGEMDGYTQISLTYFDDGILSDENGVIIDEPEEIVGDALNHFGEYEEDSVFVRSDPKRCDYEILRDLRSYAEFRSTLPPKI